MARLKTGVLFTQITTRLVAGTMFEPRSRPLWRVTKSEKVNILSLSGNTSVLALYIDKSDQSYPMSLLPHLNHLYFLLNIPTLHSIGLSSLSMHVSNPSPNLLEKRALNV